MALLWDRYHLGERKFLKARPVRLRLGTHILATNSVNLLVAAAFTVMGIFVLYLAGSSEMTSGSGFQKGIALWVAGAFGWVEKATAPIPESVLGLGILALASVFVYTTLRDRTRRGRTPSSDDDPESDVEPADHEDSADLSSTPK